MSKSKTKAQMSAELKKLRAAYKKKSAASKPAYKRSYAKKSAYADIPASIGELVAGKPGKMIGSLVGRGARALYEHISGHGDYKVSSNSLTMGTDPPSFSKSGRGMIVRHREYIMDVLGSTNFTSTVLPIQPGLKATFPWLAQVASNYEEYVVRGMIFEFKSTSSNALTSTNTALGTVVMATRYNALMPAFPDKISMENYQFCTTVKPSDSALHPIECAVGEAPLHVLYTRTGDIGGVGDLRMYDLGNFQISTVGMQATAVIGELWVSYDIELLKPRLSGVSAGYEQDHWRLGTSGYASATPFGTNPLRSSESNFGAIVVPASNTILMPYWPTDYNCMFIYTAIGTSTTLTTGITFTSGSALARVTDWTNNSGAFVSPPSGAVTGGIMYTAIYKYTASVTSVVEANRTITVGSHTPIAGYAGGDIWIIGIDTPRLALPISSGIEFKGDDTKEEKKAIACVSEDDEDPEAYAEFMRMKKAKEVSRLADPSGRDPETAAFRSKSLK